MHAQPKYSRPARMNPASRTLNIAYGKHLLQQMDVHFPQKFSAETPVVFLIHGGGFIMGRKEDFEPQALYFCQEGFVVVNLSHRLIDAGWFSASRKAMKDGFKISDQLTDVDHAVRLFKKKASEWGCGTGNMFIAGHSAGAILGMLYLLEDGHNVGVRAAGNWAGITDLTLPMDTFGGFLQPWQRTQMQSMYNKMLDYSALTGGTGDAKLVSPYWVAAKQGGMPVISIYPESNVVLHFPGESALGLMQTRRFHELLRSQGVPESFIMYPGCDHNFRGPADAWQRCISDTAAFFRAH